MAVRQYIGARYVIKIYENSQDPASAEWEQGAYEPLVMVTYNNGSYLSKKTVPASVGNPAANGAYWVQTGFYNGQIASLQAQIDAINNSTIPAIVADIDNIENIIGANRGNYIFLGDSYNNPQYSDWGNYAASAMGLSSSEYVSLYVDGGSIPNDSYNLPLSEYAATLTQDEKNNVLHIVCCGGINDTIATADTLKNHMASLVSYSKVLFPNATVYFGFIGNSIESSGILNGRDYKGIAKALNVYRQAADIGAKYLGGLEYVLHDYSLMAADGIHPTQAGGQAIGKYIKIALDEGEAHIVRNYNTTTTTDFIDTSDNVTTGISNVNVIAGGDNAYQLDVYEEDGITYISHKGRIAIIMDTFLAINNSVTLNIGKSKVDLLNGKPPVAIPVIGGCRKYNDNTKHDFTGTLQINGGNISLHIDVVDHDWETNFAADRILISEFAVSIPTMLC